MSATEPKPDHFASALKKLSIGLTYDPGTYRGAPDQRRIPELTPDEALALQQQLAERDERLKAVDRFMDREAWSFLRWVLSQGMAIEVDARNGHYKSNEEISVRLDTAANERVGLMKATLARLQGLAATQGGATT